MGKQNEVVTVEQLKELASDVGDVMEVIELINNLIDFTPSTRKEEVQKNPLFYYGKTKEALTNIFYINQGLDKKLGNVTSDLYAMVKELEDE